MKETTFTQKSTTFAIGFAVTAALFAVVPLFTHTAQAATDSVTTTRTARNASTTPKVPKVVNLTCMQTAVDAREDAILDAHEVYYTSLKAKLTARKAALHDAWGITDKVERQAAIKIAWKTAQTDHKAALNGLKVEKKAIWTIYKKTAKTSCKEVLPKEEMTTSDTAA